MLPFPSPEKVPTRMYEGIARVWTILAHCAERRQQGSLIHRSAWKGNSANFAFWGFSEVRFKGILRSSHNTSGKYYAPLSAWPELRWTSGGVGERTLPHSK